MADGTGIQWTDATWNPIVGCSVVSPGCTNCYAMKEAGRRLAHTPKYEGLTRPSKAGPVWSGDVRLWERELTAPLRWKRPRKIFVNSMGDLFHENVPDEWIDKVFAVMALAPQHTFQVLTKRAERMRAYMAGDAELRSAAASVRISPLSGDAGRGSNEDQADATVGWDVWPRRNVWLGVSTEDQTRADERIPALVATPAAVRFVSAEPLLGPLDIGWALETLTPLDWVIVGGESGPKARPMHPDWARSLRDQCVAAGVPLFFKQWGTWADADHWFDHLAGVGEMVVNGQPWKPARPLNFDAGSILAKFGDRKVEHHSSGCSSISVGKNLAGRRLDGRTWDEFPAVPAA